MTRQQTTGGVPGTNPTVQRISFQLAGEGLRDTTPGDTPATPHHQIPAVLPPLPYSGHSPQAGRPATEHGEAGEPTPHRLPPRRAPLADLQHLPVTWRVAHRRLGMAELTGPATGWWCCR